MDLEHADCVLIQGSSMAEAHPVGFRWVMRAKERGATIIHVDPRFSRTSAMADIWAPLRVGTDIVFLGGLIRYVLEHERYFRDYVVNYTNAAAIVGRGYVDTEQLDGLFSGWDPASKSYDPASWFYDAGAPAPHSPNEPVVAKDASSQNDPTSQKNPILSNNGAAVGSPRDRAVAGGSGARDPSLRHHNCVFQILRRHFARYTPEMVERACGVPQKTFHRIAQELCDNSGRERTTAICYALGWTQHTKGVQVIRSAAILQLLLGNIGRPGGGIMALRGHASIQGSTDIPTLYDILPGYLKMPEALSHEGDDTLAAYVSRHGNRLGWWAHTETYMVSLLRAWYGDAARADNDWGFGLLPRICGDHSHFPTFCDMADNKMEGMFIMGQNPAVGGQNSRLERRALAQLDWLVVRDLVETETAAFWYDSLEIERGELRTREIGTEVFLMPAAGHAEKEGTFTNTQRLLQWREKAVDPPGDARSEAWFIVHLGRRLRARARADKANAEAATGADAPLLALTWDYELEGAYLEPKIEQVVIEINGYRFGDGAPVAGFSELRGDGSTACGCWIYSGVYPSKGRNRAAERKPKGRYGHGWGFTWPADRRILYNRASADPEGRPWSERKKLIWWDPAEARWRGFDTPDFPVDKSPHYRPGRPRASGVSAKSDIAAGAARPAPEGLDGLSGLDGHAGTSPFLMQPDGVAWLFAPIGLKDGPLPTHYEPVESPTGNLLYPGQAANPAAERFERPDNPLITSGDPAYPYALTTYRLTEHHTAGGMSRWLSRLAELQPEMFCEISPELAEEVGVSHSDWVVVRTPRGAIEARALVTRRIRPLRIDTQLRVAGTIGPVDPATPSDSPRPDPADPSYSTQSATTSDSVASHFRTIHQVAMPFHWGRRGLVTGDSANDLIPLLGEPNVSIHESKALLCNLEPGRLPRGAPVLRPGLDSGASHEPGERG